MVEPKVLFDPEHGNIRRHLVLGITGLLEEMMTKLLDRRETTREDCGESCVIHSARRRSPVRVANNSAR